MTSCQVHEHVVYEELKYEKTMPFSLLRFFNKLSACADELRGERLSPIVVKKNKK
jgi:UDP-glucose 4-epimerase